MSKPKQPLGTRIAKAGCLLILLGLGFIVCTVIAGGAVVLLAGA